MQKNYYRRTCCPLTILPVVIDTKQLVMVRLRQHQTLASARPGKWLTVFGVVLLHRLKPAAAPARCFLLRRLGLCLQRCQSSVL